MTASPRSETAALLREALARHRDGDLAAARAGYRRVLAAAPAQADALRLLGVAHLQQGRAAEAAALLRRALAVRPEMAEAWGDLGAALRHAGLPAEAAACWREALRLRPQDAEFRRALATCPPGPPPPDPAALFRQATENHRNQRHAEAAAQFRRLSLLQPDPSGALINAAAALLALARPEEALASLEAVPETGHPAAWRHRAAAHSQLGDAEATLAACRSCLALDPDNAEAQFGEAGTLLLLGDYAAGWAGYEARWRLSEPPPPQAAPLWLGQQPIAGRTLLLRAEQGFGDILQFVRYAPLLRRRGARVVLAVPPDLRRLLAGLADAIIAPDETPPPHDWQTPLLSLPLACATTLASVPADITSIQADANLCARWAARLGPRRRLRVGVAWSGDPNTQLGWLRRVPPQALLPALAATGAELHVLHKLIAPQDRAAVAGHRTYEAELTDFAETAALLAQLDVVVSSCTSVAHLAGAMGCKTFIMLQHAADFRWLRHRADSPWYPTATLFRQTERGEWGTVIEAVAAALC